MAGLRAVALVLTLASAPLAVGTTGAPGAPECDQEICPSTVIPYASGRADVATFVTQFVPQSAHSKKTRAGRRKASIAAKQPSCGTLATVSQQGDWRACSPGSGRGERIVQTVESTIAALQRRPAARNISIIHVDASADELSSSFAREAASLAYKLRDHGQTEPAITVWFVPTMETNVEPFDPTRMVGRVLVRSFEIPDAVAAAGSEALLHFLSVHCGVDLLGPSQPDFPGRLIGKIRDGDLGSVTELVAAGVSVNPSTARGEPCITTNWEQECFRPLHEAIAAAHSDADLDIARALLRGGADVRRRGADGQSLLHRIAWDWANTPTDVEAPDNPKNIVAAWLMNKSPIGFEQIDDLGQTVFHVAARYHHHWMLETMLSHGKLRFAKGVIPLSDNSGNTVLHYAAGGAIWYRDISIAAVVPSFGSWSEDARRSAWSYDNPTKYDGYSICRQKLSEQEMGSDRMPPDRGTVRVLSTIMSNCGFFGRMVSLLITTQHLPAPSFNARNHAGDTPLHLAALANDPVVVRLLISSGADVEAKNERGLVAADVAALSGSEEAAVTLSKFRRVAADPEVAAVSGSVAKPPLLTREAVWRAHTKHSEVVSTQGSSGDDGDSMAEQLLTVLASGVASANNGGWDTALADRPANQGGAADLKSRKKCGVVRKNRISSSEFIDDFVSLSRPALISPFSYQQLKAWRVFDKWSRSRLLGTYGDLKLQVRREQFEDSTRLKAMTMREFIASWGQDGNDGQAAKNDDVTRPGQKKRILLRHFILKLIILPRQARDKHRESTQKRERRFLIGYVREATTATYRLLRDLEWGESDQAEEGAEEQPTGEVKALLAWLVCAGTAPRLSLSLSLSGD
jgi:ankyrin repeat protein